MPRIVTISRCSRTLRRRILLLVPCLDYSPANTRCMLLMEDTHAKRRNDCQKSHSLAQHLMCYRQSPTSMSEICCDRSIGRTSVPEPPVNEASIEAVCISASCPTKSFLHGKDFCQKTQPLPTAHIKRNSPLFCFAEKNQGRTIELQCRMICNVFETRAGIYPLRLDDRHLAIIGPASQVDC